MTNHGELKRLLDAVPNPVLHLQPMAGDKPAIFVGEQAMLRYRDSPEGVAYAALVVAAVNALPDLLAGAQGGVAPAAVDRDEPDADSPLSLQIEQKVGQVLALQPEFRKASAKLLGKLIYAAIEPLVLPSASTALTIESAAPAAAPNAKAIQAIRLEAVNDFLGFLLEHGDSHHLPSEESLTSYAHRWHDTHNVLADPER